MQYFNLSSLLLAFLLFSNAQANERDTMTDSHQLTKDAQDHEQYGMSSVGPVAYGTVLLGGSKYAGSANWSSSYNATDKRYEITITGESYYYMSYATVITPAGDQRYCNSNSASGKLLVECYDSNGNQTTSRFGFISFKP
ncbi:hypothetical protein [Shewanella surugensis]|uniref:Secreted protein n=1 Tax=Shewanella surugensis TaxID=212020 RepID=A0ABT0LE68_9GAMM|nr:hypothetical protein [Shewanella surugensis]MCL1126002.1 hypothetical protein [Shewanella surugensis]